MGKNSSKLSLCLYFYLDSIATGFRKHQQLMKAVSTISLFVLTNFNNKTLITASVGKPYLGKPSDMWALGVVLFTMLYGQFPFYDSVPQELFRKIKAVEFNIPT